MLGGTVLQHTGIGELTLNITRMELSHRKAQDGEL